jgi:hypothetical protein
MVAWAVCLPGSDKLWEWPAAPGWSRVRIRTFGWGENLPGLSGAGGGDAQGRHFLAEDAVPTSSLSLLLLRVQILIRSDRTVAKPFGVVPLMKAPSWSPRCASQSVMVKLPGGDVCEGGARVLAGCSVCWCACSGSRESSGPPMTVFLIGLGTWVPSGGRDRRRDDNAPAQNVILIFFDVVLLRSFLLAG